MVSVVSVMLVLSGPPVLTVMLVQLVVQFSVVLVIKGLNLVELYVPSCLATIWPNPAQNTMMREERRPSRAPALLEKGTKNPRLKTPRNEADGPEITSDLRPN